MAEFLSVEASIRELGLIVHFLLCELKSGSDEGADDHPAKGTFWMCQCQANQSYMHNRCLANKLQATMQRQFC